MAKHKKLFRNTGLIVVTILVTLLAKWYVFELYVIPSDSMSPTLIPGDVVVLNKLSYGVRKAHAGKVTRQWGYSSPERSDVIIFNMPVADTVMSRYPMEDYYEMVRLRGRDEIIGKPGVYGEIETYPLTQRNVYIKRCMGAPGDSIYLEEGTLYRQEVKTSIQGPDSENTANEAKKEEVGEQVAWYNYIFPHEASHNWNMDNWGPLYVPKVGDLLPLTMETIPFYERLISAYEGNELQIRGEDILINGKVSDHYQVKKNYYLVMGDNRFFSHDSRFWGYLPEDHIIGEAAMVLFSYKNGKLLWDRFFKKL